MGFDNSDDDDSYNSFEDFEPSGSDSFSSEKISPKPPVFSDDDVNLDDLLADTDVGGTKKRGLPSGTINRASSGSVLVSPGSPGSDHSPGGKKGSPVGYVPSFSSGTRTRRRVSREPQPGRDGDSLDQMFRKRAAVRDPFASKTSKAGFEISDSSDEDAQDNLGANAPEAPPLPSRAGIAFGKNTPSPTLPTPTPDFKRSPVSSSPTYVNTSERIRDVESKWKQERLLLEEELGKAKARVLEVEQSLASKTDEFNKTLNAQLTKLKDQHVAELLSKDAELQSMKRVHLEELDAVRSAEKSEKELTRLTNELALTSSKLVDLEHKVMKKNSLNDEAKAVQFEARERLVEELEKNSKSQLDRTEAECARLTELLVVMETNQKSASLSNESERVRLREEHARIEGLQMSLKTEADILRQDLSAEKRALREDRASWESTKRQQELHLMSQLDGLDSDRRRLENDRSQFDAERRAKLREEDATFTRLKEEEQRLSMIRAAVSKEESLIKEKLAYVDRATAELSVPQNALLVEKESIEREHARLEKWAAELKKEKDMQAARNRKAAEDRKVAENKNIELERLRNDLDLDRQEILATKRQMQVSQAQFTGIRLQVAQERKAVESERRETCKQMDSLRETLMKHSVTEENINKANMTLGDFGLSSHLQTLLKGEREREINKQTATHKLTDKTNGAALRLRINRKTGKGSSRNRILLNNHMQAWQNDRASMNQYLASQASFLHNLADHGDKSFQQKLQKIKTKNRKKQSEYANFAYSSNSDSQSSASRNYNKSSFKSILKFSSPSSTEKSKTSESSKHTVSSIDQQLDFSENSESTK